MKHFTVFVLLFSMACEPEHDEEGGPVFLEAPDVSDPDKNIEVCDEESGLCWSYPFSEYDVQMNSDEIYFARSECPWGHIVNQITGEIYDGTDVLNSICNSIGMRLATSDEFINALKKCSVFKYDKCKNSEVDCPESERICGMKCDNIKLNYLTDTCNEVISCDIPYRSDSWFRCVKSID